MLLEIKLVTLFFILFLSSINIKVINAEIDCTIYSNDLDIINLNPFFVRVSFVYPAFTSVDYNRTSLEVKEFRIFNDVNPSLNIYCLKHLEKLQLVNTNLTILPDIKNFKKLTSLIISSDNGMIDQHLSSKFGQLTSSTILELNDIKNLVDLPKEIQYLTELQSLTLQKIPNLKDLSDENLSKLTNLRELTLNILPNISNLPSTIHNFQLLEKLEIIQTNIENIKLKNLNNLSNIKISVNSILKNLLIENMLKLISIEIRNNNELLTLKLQN